MDYHADRFRDASLFFYKGEKLLGVLPASRTENEVVSHDGLTYGGFLLGSSAHAIDVGEMLDLAIDHYRKNSCKSLTIKAIPFIYHSYPSDDELYWLFRRGALLKARSLSTAISLDTPIPFSTLRRRKVKLALREGIVVKRLNDDADYRAFWAILTSVLQEQHGKLPVHTLAEISLLRECFSENIVLYGAIHPVSHKMLAGTLLFVTNQVFHTQYIATSDAGRETGALDAIFWQLIQDFSLSRQNTEISQRFFDFGISTEDGGTVLNEGLIFQKEGFGGRSVVYDAYYLDL